MYMHKKLALAAALALCLSVADAADVPRFGQPIASSDLAPWDIRPEEYDEFDWLYGTRCDGLPRSDSNRLISSDETWARPIPRGRQEETVITAKEQAARVQP
jgi:hypothetical protein